MIAVLPLLLLGLLVMHGGLGGLPPSSMAHLSAAHPLMSHPSRADAVAQTAAVAQTIRTRAAGSPDCPDRGAPDGPAGHNTHPGPLCGAFLRASSTIDLLLQFAAFSGWLLAAAAAGQPAAAGRGTGWRGLPRAWRPQPPDPAALCVLRL
ncbi:hypothetical protein [Frankia sp. Cj5]|uniref:hypothetical protein n=1 Tax=Frankia sp. Cj5 TaxID=2880978 RepID=UPI001EF3D9FF|nr:hypothetical protein [Frankia sp. Cj5]